MQSPSLACPRYHISCRFAEKKGRDLVDPTVNVKTSVFLFHRELHRRTVGKVAAYQCPGKVQREGPVIYVLVCRQRHRRRDRSTLQTGCGRRDRAG